MWRKAEGQRSPLRLHACPVLAATSAMLSVRHAYPRPHKGPPWRVEFASQASPISVGTTSLSIAPLYSALLMRFQHLPYSSFLGKESGEVTRALLCTERVSDWPESVVIVVGGGINRQLKASLTSELL